MSGDRCLVVVAVLAGTCAAVAGGCAKAPPIPPPPSITIAAPVEAKVKAEMTIAADPDANPNTSGRPSPVVVRIYQLKTDAAFLKADLNALMDDDQKILGVEIISRDEFVLEPSERRTLDVTVSAETRFVGAIANYQNYRNADWRAIIPTPRGGLNVAIERARIVLSLAR